MLKSIAKWLCPSSRKIAEAAADKIQNGVNGIDAEKKALVSKYATAANEIGEIGNRLTSMLKDGSIDDAEKSTLVAYIEMLADKAKALVFG